MTVFILKSIHPSLILIPLIKSKKINFEVTFVEQTKTLTFEL